MLTIEKRKNLDLTIEKIIFAILWIALMLMYLLGDVLRIFSGDFVPGEIDGQPVGQSMWLMAMGIMVIPILMVVLNILIPGDYMKWPNIIVALFFFLFNVIGIKGYKPYDQVLLSISFGLNFVMVYLGFILY